jgi:chromosome segregation ATPase
MSRSGRLETENKRLSLEIEEMKQISAKTSSLNVKYRMQLENERNVKDDLMEGNLKLKKKVNKLSSQCFEQDQKIRMLESNLRRSMVASTRSSRVSVKMISDISDVMQSNDPKKTQAYVDLQKKYGELESEYQQALAIIDEMEFELGDVIFSFHVGQFF